MKYKIMLIWMGGFSTSRLVQLMLAAAVGKTLMLKLTRLLKVN